MKSLSWLISFRSLLKQCFLTKLSLFEFLLCIRLCSKPSEGINSPYEHHRKNEILSFYNLFLFYSGENGVTGCKMTCPVSRPPAVVGICIWAMWTESSVVLIIICPVSKHRELTCKTQNAHISQAQANRYAHLFLQNLYRLLLCENRHLKNSDMCVM